MVAQREPQRVLIVSGNEKGAEMICEILDRKLFSPMIIVSSAVEARRQTSMYDYDIVFINTPLPDEFGTELAVELAENSYSGIVLFVKNDAYDNVSYYVETKGVYCVSKPLSKQFLNQVLHLIVATRNRLARAQVKTENLKVKIEETRTISRAKLLLMQNLSLSESEAHRYIEKQAMDTCVKRIEIAMNIIKTYEN